MTYLKESFPRTRLRRMRHQAWRREMHEETNLAPNDFVWPIFIRSDEGAAEIATMPGVKRYTIDELGVAALEAQSLGIQAIALFAQTDPALKNPKGKEAFNSKNLICQATRLLKRVCPHMGVIADVALDPYTDHGHDGLLVRGEVVNDPTISMLQKQALILAEAGVDAIAPSDMMDGRIGALRDTLDSKGFQNVLIIAYGAKYASSLYGPFREAAGSAQSLKGASKKTYQMNPANSREAMREIALDIQEGADAVIIKPGTFYLDVVKEASKTFATPIHVYHVSGEYSMLRWAAEHGALDYETVLMENLLAFKRAGAMCIWTYGALDAVRVLKQRA